MTTPKRILNYLLQGLLLSLTALALNGCAYSFDEQILTPPEEVDDDVYLTLNISTADSFGKAATSRAGSYYYEEPDRQNERLNNLAVYILREDSTIEDSRRLKVNPTQNTLSVSFKLTQGKKTIYLFGNEESFPQEFRDLLTATGARGHFPEDELKAITVSREANQPFFTTAQNIPMCESFSYTLDKQKAGSIYFDADVFVTRVAVKYTFIARDDVDVATVRLFKMGGVQYVMPRNVTYNPGKYKAPEVINGVAGRNIETFSVPFNNKPATFEAKLTGKTKIQITDEIGKKTTAYRYDPIYLMETPGSSFSMSVRYDAAEKPGEWYEAQELPNLPLLPRNTHVVVYMGADNRLNCEVDVVPYRGCILEPYFGLERD